MASAKFIRKSQNFWSLTCGWTRDGERNTKNTKCTNVLIRFVHLVLFVFRSSFLARSTEFFLKQANLLFHGFFCCRRSAFDRRLRRPDVLLRLWLWFPLFLPLGPRPLGLRSPLWTRRHAFRGSSRLHGWRWRCCLNSFWLLSWPGPARGFRDERLHGETDPLH